MDVFSIIAAPAFSGKDILRLYSANPGAPPPEAEEHQNLPLFAFTPPKSCGKIEELPTEGRPPP